MEAYPLDAAKIIADDRLMALGKNGLGFYLTLKCYFLVNGSVPKDAAALSSLLRTDEQTLEPVYQKLIDLFSEGENGRLIDPEIEEYRETVKREKEAKSEKYRKNIQARWNKQKEDPKEVAKKNEKYKEEIKTIWEYFCRKLNKYNNYLFTDGRKRLIRKALERGWNVPQITQAIDNFSKDVWFNANTPMDIKYVLRVKRDGEDMVGTFLDKKKSKTGADKIGAGDTERNYGDGEIREF